jgi:copper(I)-binding protein
MQSFLRAAAFAIVALALAGAAGAHEYTVGTITVFHPWAAATPPGATTGAAYMKIVNKGKKTLRLVKMSTEVADKVEVHSMSMTNGIMRMRPLKAPLKIKPGATLELNHEGLHLMLIGLKKPLVEEEMVSFKLQFAGGKTMDVELYIEPIGATAGKHDMH